MKKPSLLYASPFAPMKSGISDYSEILVYALKNEFEITLLIDDYKLENMGKIIFLLKRMIILYII